MLVYFSSKLSKEAKSLTNEERANPTYKGTYRKTDRKEKERKSAIWHNIII